MKKLLLALAILACLAGPVWATAFTVVTSTPGIVNLTPGGASDVYDASLSYSGSRTFTNGMYLVSIGFTPSAANDTLIVRNGSASGAVIARFKSIDGGPQIKYFAGVRAFRPYIAGSENTWGTPTSVYITIDYSNQP